MKLIAVVDSFWGIAREGKLLFDLPPDMKYFKSMTTGNAVVMGRKTLYSFPNALPLTQRVNIVLTTTLSPIQGAVIVSDLQQLQSVVTQQAKDVYVIGGQSVYAQLLDYCDTAYITKVFAQGHADQFMHNLDRLGNWSIQQQTQIMTYGSLDYCFCTYVNSSTKPLSQLK